MRLATSLLILCSVARFNSGIVAQEPFATVFEITAAQRLSLEQIDQLVAGEQVDEAVELIVRTMDEADGRLVAVPRGREIENELVRFVPLELFLHDRLLRWGVSRPAILEKYRRVADASAAGRLRLLRTEEDVSKLAAEARLMLATSYGDDALLLLADKAMQRGHLWTAIGALRQIDPRWQAVEEAGSAEQAAAVGWELVLPKLTDQAMNALENLWADAQGTAGATALAWPLGCYVGSELPQAEVGLRLMVAYASVGEAETAERLGRLLRAGFGTTLVMFNGTQQTVDQVVSSLMRDMDPSLRLGQADKGSDPSDLPGQFRSQSGAVGDWGQLGRDARRVYRTQELGDVAAFPSWVKVLEVPVEEQHVLPGEPATGWSKRNLSADQEASLTVRTVPIIHQNLALVQKGKYIFGMDVQTGATWPAGNANPWFYQQVDTDGIKPKSGIMPVDGQPWFVLGAEAGRLVGRFGPSESGWLESVRPELPVSQIVMLDLEREGQMFAGYPIRARSLYGSRLATLMEFEGVPLIVGRRMFAGVTRRDNATLTTSIACYDVASGQLLYETKVIAAARHLPAETANRLAGALVSYREGVVYYHGDSGAIAAMDADSGQLLWLVRYARAELHNSAYPRRRRASGAKCSPVALMGPLAIAGPADCDRLLAVDAMDGRLIWATAEGEADDVDQVLGEVGQQIIVGGDALYRIDRSVGAVIDRWPAGTTSQIHGALPQPRRHGRGLMAGKRVFWPTPEAIWILDAATFTPLRRLDLRPTGLVGGDLAAAEGMLVVADGQRIAGFRGQSPKQLVSAAASDE